MLLGNSLFTVSLGSKRDKSETTVRLGPMWVAHNLDANQSSVRGKKFTEVVFGDCRSDSRHKQRE